MPVISAIFSYGFSAFLVVSPLTSYLDTIISIHRNKSSSGFSMDVCGIMLVASLLRINFWLGDRFDIALLIQSLVMIVTQIFLLHECLEYRPLNSMSKQVSKRPFQLWQWQDRRQYWRFVIQFALTLGVLQIVFGQSKLYIALLGTVGLGIESTLPIPQFLNNTRTRSVQGVRASMLASWVTGDICKLIFFFLGSDTVSIQFKLCAFVQTFFDISIAIQYLLWHNKPATEEMRESSRELDAMLPI